MHSPSNEGFQSRSTIDLYRYVSLHGMRYFNLRQNQSVNQLLPPGIGPCTFAAPHVAAATSLLTHIPSPSVDASLLGFSFMNEHSHALLKPEPKPTQSYIGLIAMAIISASNNRLVLSDIYQWIMTNYIYFRTRGTGWKNSIRHNLSLNDCFIKCGRCPNGKGHYWTIHPANMDDFKRGDFRRRRAQQRVKRYAQQLNFSKEDYRGNSSSSSEDELISPVSTCSSFQDTHEDNKGKDPNNDLHSSPKKNKKPFDIESLLGIGQPPGDECH